MCFEQCYWDVNRCLPKGRLLEPEIRSILQWESHRSMYGRGCFEMCSVVFYLHWVVKLGFLIIVFGKRSCRKSIQEWGKGLHFSSCTFTKCELFAWLLLYYWSLSCEYTVQEIVGVFCLFVGVVLGNFKPNKLEETFSDIWNGKALCSKSSLLYSLCKSEEFHSLFMTQPVEKVLDFSHKNVSNKIV